MRNTLHCKSLGEVGSQWAAIPGSIRRNLGPPSHLQARAAAREIRRRASHEQPLEVPESAVVVPGSRAVTKGKGKSGEWNLSLYTPVIVKYRDEKTERGIELEEWLR